MWVHHAVPLRQVGVSRSRGVASLRLARLLHLSCDLVAILIASYNSFRTTIRCQIALHLCCRPASGTRALGIASKFTLNWKVWAGQRMSGKRKSLPICHARMNRSEEETGKRLRFVTITIRCRPRKSGLRPVCAPVLERAMDRAAKPRRTMTRGRGTRKRHAAGLW